MLWCIFMNEGQILGHQREIKLWYSHYSHKYLVAECEESNSSENFKYIIPKLYVL